MRPGSPCGRSDPRASVLAGGLSHERDVSLRSGRRVAEALRGAGARGRGARRRRRAAAGCCATEPPACVVPLLHGEAGEDGAIREVLELLGVPYVGSRARRPAGRRSTSRSPRPWSPGPGSRTPASACAAARDVPRARRGRGDGRARRPARAAADGEAGPRRLGARLHRRSATPTRCPRRWSSAFAYGDTALVERLRRRAPRSPSRSSTPATGPRALPAVAIVPDGGVYDYTARYTAGQHRVRRAGASSPTTVAAECARVAVAAHEALGLRDLSRSDLIVDADGAVWFLEVNVAPGLTETSTVPLSVAGRRPRPRSAVRRPRAGRRLPLSPESRGKALPRSAGDLGGGSGTPPPHIKWSGWYVDTPRRGTTRLHLERELPRRSGQRGTASPAAPPGTGTGEAIVSTVPRRPRSTVAR